MLYRREVYHNINLATVYSSDEKYACHDLQIPPLGLWSQNGKFLYRACGTNVDSIAVIDHDKIMSTKSVI